MTSKRKLKFRKKFSHRKPLSSVSHIFVSPKSNLDFSIQKYERSLPFKRLNSISKIGVAPQNAYLRKMSMRSIDPFKRKYIIPLYTEKEESLPVVNVRNKSSHKERNSLDDFLPNDFYNVILRKAGYPPPIDTTDPTWKELYNRVRMRTDQYAKEKGLPAFSEISGNDFLVPATYDGFPDPLSLDELAALFSAALLYSNSVQVV